MTTSSINLTHRRTQAYDRSQESTDPIPEGTPSIRQPAINPNYSTEWELYAEGKVVEHRNGLYQTSDIFGGIGGFRLLSNDTPSRLAYYSQDQLPHDERFDLKWILERLLINGMVILREFRSDEPIESFEKTAVGYWEIKRCT